MVVRLWGRLLHEACECLFLEEGVVACFRVLLYQVCSGLPDGVVNRNSFFFWLLGIRIVGGPGIRIRLGNSLAGNPGSF